MKQSNKSGARILQALSLVFLMIPVLYAVMGTGIISNIGYEDVYWERARFLLGQGGATLYGGSSVCSLGYSLVLMPICAILKSPYAAYKAAILLNGVFLCSSYVVSVMTARRLFPKEKETFLSAACFFAAIIPALSTAKSFTGPKMIVLFLVWLSFYCFVQLYQQYCSGRMVVLAVCLILLPFFQIGLLGFDIAVIVCLGILVERKKPDETVWLKLMLAVLIGIAAGNVAERFVLHGFAEAAGLDLVPLSSLEVYLDGLRTGWENGSFSGLFSALVGKAYVLLVNSLLLVCPAVWILIKKRGWKLQESVDFIFYVFLFQFILTALFDNSRSVSVGLTSLSGVEVCVPLLVLIGIVYVKYAADWSKELIAYLLVTCLTAIMTAGVYQKNGVGQISNTNNGLLLLFQNWGMNATAVVYCAACAVILLAMIFLFCVKADTKKQKLNKMLRTVGLVGFFAVSFSSSLLVYRHTAVKFTESSIQTLAPVASVLSELGGTGECYYYADGGIEKELVILQSLAPRQEIQIIKNDKKEQNEFFELLKDETQTPIILSKTGKKLTERTFPKELPDYKLLYITEQYALWARRGSEEETAIEQVVEQRMEQLPLHSSIDTDEEDTLSDEEVEELESEAQETETQNLADDNLEQGDQEPAETGTEKKKEMSRTVTFGKNATLAPGTYRMEIYFGKVGELSGKTGDIKLSYADGSLVTKKIDESVLNDSNGMVSIQFSSADVMRSFKVQLNGSIAANAEVDHIYYWKTSPAYTVGLNGGNTADDACAVIREVDELCGKNGTVAYIASDTQNIGDLSVNCFEERLPGYDVQIITREEAASAQTDYLIGVTSSHSYYNAMEQYSLIQRGKYYTVLVRNGSEAYETYLENGNELLSQGKVIEAAAFTDGAENSSKKSADKNETSIAGLSDDNQHSGEEIALEAGSYVYYLDIVQLTRNVLPKGEIGSVQLFDAEEETILVEQTIKDTDILREENGSTYIKIPLALKEKCDALSYKLETGDNLRMQSSLRGIELTAEKYQFGQEEAELEKLCEIVNENPEAEKLFIVQKFDQIKDSNSGFEYLAEKMPDVQIETITYGEANGLLADAFLLTHGLSADYLRLLGKYNIIGQAGQYTLWVRSEGKAVQIAEEQGYSALNNGRKISLESLALASGTETEDGTVVKLPKAVYNITLKLTAPEIESDDTVEVYLMCDKSENAVEKEIDELIEQGYTKQEANEEVELQVECANATYAGYQFEDDGNVVITMRTNKERALENLVVDAFSWHGCEVEGEVLWVEIV